jgi:hypothetical protein
VPATLQFLLRLRDAYRGNSGCARLRLHIWRGLFLCWCGRRGRGSRRSRFGCCCAGG